MADSPNIPPLQEPPAGPLRVRHIARQWALQLLFQLDMAPEPFDKAAADFYEQLRCSPHFAGLRERDWRRTWEQAHETAAKVLEHRAEIDELLRRHAQNWTVERMGAVDRNVMRIAAYEMLHRPDTPTAVSIDEAVEIAKTFGDEDSGAFTNGVLDSVRLELEPDSSAQADE